MAKKDGGEKPARQRPVGLDALIGAELAQGRLSFEDTGRLLAARQQVAELKARLLALEVEASDDLRSLLDLVIETL